MTEKSGTVLVTGGAGFIGSHASKALAASGLRPVCVDALSTGHADAVKWGPLYRVDLRDASKVAHVMERERPDAVLHFAASAYVGESVADPVAYYDNNVVGMLRLLDACRDAKVRKIVFSSSCASYGAPSELPIREDTVQNPINPYGRTKLICEQILRDYDTAFGIRSVCLRYFNAAGADPEGDLIEDHDPETHLIPLALMATSGRRPPLKVYGTDYPTPDGTCVRDYIHVTDLAEAHLAALRYLDCGGVSDAFNIGSGQGYSILEVAATIGQTFGRDMPWCAAGRRVGDPPLLVAEIAKAKNILGFRPRHSDMTTILSDAGPSFGLISRAEDAI